MNPRVPRIFGALGISLAVLAGATGVPAQEKPDRPPWAQPSNSQPPAGQPSSGRPSTSQSPGQPGGIVQTPVPEPEKPQQPPSTKGAIKVNVNLVNVLVSVVDEQKRPAPNLPQKVEFFESETKWPLDIALMIDASLSAHMDIQFERQAAEHFIRQVLQPDDRMAIFSFDETVTQRTTFTDKVQVLQDAVAKIPDGAGTSIYDAVLLGSQALGKRTGERRRVIVLVTDGGETTSQADFETARRAAVRGEVLLYTVLIRPVKNENGRNTAGEHALQTITETTGGAMFFPNVAQELADIFDRIESELRTQYRLGYYPNPRGPANTYRTIEVKVLPGYAARHRASYLTQ